MGRYISDETKKSRNWGNINSEEAVYHSFKTIPETYSYGLSTLVWDWKVDRSVHTFSIAETKVFYSLRWNDAIVEIKEHVPMDLEETKMIAESLGYKIPFSGEKMMTTDFVVTDDRGFKTAINVKASRKKTSRKSMHYATIEETYWKNHGVKWIQVFGEDLDDLEMMNLASIVQYYDEKNVFDDISMIKHLIAIKELKMPLDEFVDYGALAEFYRNCDRVETFIKKMNDKQWAKNRNLLMNFEYNREIVKQQHNAQVVLYCLGIIYYALIGTFR